MLLKEPKAFEALVFTKVANGSEEDVEEPRPFRGVINIGECVQVGQLSEETFQAILKGCIAPGVNMEKEHVNKREQIYSFIDIFPCFFKREGDKRLIQCMALSRLVFPTSSIVTLKLKVLDRISTLVIVGLAQTPFVERIETF